MSDLQTAYVDAFVSYDTVPYSQRGTVFFQFEECVASSALRPILDKRLGFMTIPQEPKARFLQPRKRNSRFPDGFRASLVVTDSPTEVFGFIERQKIERLAKFGDVKTACAEQGVDVSSWPEFHALDRDVQGRALTSSLVMYCQKQRQTEEQVLGYRRLSWDQFAEEYELVHDEYSQQLLAFPKSKVPAYAVYANWETSRERVANTTSLLSLTYEATNDGHDALWICSDNNPNTMFASIAAGHNNVVVPLDAFHKIVGAIDTQLMNGAKPYLIPQLPKIAMRGAPTLMSRLRFVHYLREKSQASQFTLDDLKKIARDLNIKGFSDKTKAELSIIIAETISHMGTDKDEPALVFTSFAGGAPTDIALDSKSAWFKEQLQATPEDYFKFAMRVVSNAAYAPNHPPLPGGRTPTDGNFPSYFAIEPLNIFG